MPVRRSYISYNVDQKTVFYLFDEDVETRVKARKPDYWVGLDMKGDMLQGLAQISFTPVSDGNDIQKVIFIFFVDMTMDGGLLEGVLQNPITRS